MGDMKVHRGKTCLFMQHVSLFWYKYINENGNAIVYVKIIKKTALRGYHFVEKLLCNKALLIFLALIVILACQY